MHRVLGIAVVAIVLGYTVAMAVETWGLLPKSQTDPETIEEAVARIVSQHDADPAAHLGATGSLTGHRASGVIDHLAGSVVADKRNAREVYIHEQFANIDAWPIDDGDAYAEGYTLVLHKAIGNTTAAQVTNDLSAFDRASLFDHEFMLQFAQKFGSAANTPQFVASFMANPSGDTDGFGVVVDVDGATFYIAVGGVYSSSTKYLLDPSVFHTYRMWHSLEEHKLRFYVDGDVAFEVDVVSHVVEDAIGLQFRHTGADGVHTFSYIADLSAVFTL